MRMMPYRRRTGGDSQAERAAAARFGIARTRGPVARAVWQAGVENPLPVASASDVARAAAYAGAADLILFDAKTPKGAARRHGVAFDWSLLAGYRGALPWGLAGGLNPTNVAEAIARTGAPLVDTSSGVESAPGVDTDKITNSTKPSNT